MNTVELTDEQLEEVTGGCGSYRQHHQGRRGGYGHGGQGDYGYGGGYGYQGPHINYNTQSLDFSQTTSLKESTTQYNVW